MVMSNGFSIQFRRDGAVVVVGISGELDMATAPLLRDALKEIIVDQGNLSVCVDLTHTTFMDSTGLNALVGALKDMRTLAGLLNLSDPPPMIMRLLELTGLSKVFDIVSSEDTPKLASVPAWLEPGRDVDQARRPPPALDLSSRRMLDLTGSGEEVQPC